MSGSSGCTVLRLCTKLAIKVSLETDLPFTAFKAVPPKKGLLSSDQYAA